jgi:hypothetical protein
VALTQETCHISRAEARDFEKRICLGAAAGRVVFILLTWIENSKLFFLQFTHVAFSDWQNLSRQSVMNHPG